MTSQGRTANTKPTKNNKPSLKGGSVHVFVRSKIFPGPCKRGLRDLRSQRYVLRRFAFCCFYTREIDSPARVKPHM